MPALLISFGSWGLKDQTFDIKTATGIYANLFYWLWLAVLVAGQILLLLLLVNLTERRLPARRPLRVPVIVTAFFLANLLFAGILSVLCAIFWIMALNT